jgi:hypothetical protein
MRLSTDFLKQFKNFYDRLQTSFNKIENENNKTNKEKVLPRNNLLKSKEVNNKISNNNDNVYEVTIIYNPDDKTLIIKKDITITYQFNKEFKVLKSKEGNYKISGFISLDGLISIDSKNILDFLKEQKQNENICQLIFESIINLLDQLNNNYLQEQQEEEEEEDDDYGYHYNYNYNNDENYAYSDKEMDSYVPQENETETQITQINLKLNMKQKEINLIDINNYKIIKTISFNKNKFLLILQFDEKQSELNINILEP